MSRTVRFIWFWLAVSALYAFTAVAADFSGTPIGGTRGAVEIAVQWGAVSVCAACVMGLAAVWRRVFCVLFPIFAVTGAAGMYFRLCMGVSINATSIELAMVNDLSTWTDVVTPTLLLGMAAAAVVGCGVVWVRWRYVRSPRHKMLWAVVLAMGACAPYVVKRLYAPVTARMPYVLWTATYEYLENRRGTMEERNNFEHTPASTDADSLTVVLVIGESLRPDHLQLNGYRRPTTPRLCGRKNVVSLPYVTTEPYFTHTSVPRIVTRADSAHPDRAYSEQSFIPLAAKSGYRTAWISNQDAVPTYSYFMHEADTLVLSSAGRSLYDFNKWLDTDMLPAIDDFLASPYPLKLAVLHTIGSHWWYPAHSSGPTEVFSPVADSRVLSELTHDQIINSYDNTVVSTDEFLDSLISRLDTGEPAIVIYVSDHGECLGENGVYLHASDAAPLHRTAAMVWYSDSYAARYPEAVEALGLNAGKPFTTDAIFHTVLRGARINTPVYEPKNFLD